MAQYQHLDGLFLALSDPTRRAVIGRLGRGAATVTELAAPFDMALPSFMKHIRQLEQSGWIATEKTGRVRTCRLEPVTFGAAQAWLDEQRAIWEGRTNRLEAFVTRTSPETAK
ncbi:MAG: transcriptional regulator [Hyphomicrobiales bacterium]|nr:MAG: transcriptional regulator [Hyphomicrobiales bacterium]